MTHDELRDYIDRFDSAGMVDFPAIKAIRAVVELHTPWDYTFPNAGKVSYCGGCPNDSENGHPEWPCDTIQAIEKELI